MPPTKPRRRPSVNITLARAKRLHHLVQILAEGPIDREHLLKRLKVGLRTYYRELELLKRFGIKITLTDKIYGLKMGVEDARDLLPFPNPQLSFGEVAELARGQGPAAKRLAELLAAVVEPVPAKSPQAKSRKSKS